MSGREIAIAKLNATPAVITAVGVKVWPSVAEQRAVPPYILVHKPAQENRQLLEGSAEYPRSRVSVECIGTSAASADDLGELIYAAFKNVTNATIAGFEFTVIPADLDTDDYSDDRTAFRRIIDFYIDWRLATVVVPSDYIPSLDFSDPRNSQYFFLLLAAGALPAGSYAPRLDYSDGRNSQYLLLLMV